MKRGAANQNVPQRFVTSFVWELPAARSASPVVKYVTGNWRMSGILTFQSGLPFTVGAVGDVLAGVDFANTANLIGAGNPVLDAGRSKGAKILQYFDPTRFSNPGPNTIGNLGRNALEGPGSANVDMALAKGLRFPFLAEAGAVELRLETFNTLNRTNFSNPVSSMTNSNFGRLTGAGAPRILQMAVKIIF